jgi:arsenite methyltransferase
MNETRHNGGPWENPKELAAGFHAQLIQEAYEQLASNGASSLCCSPTEVYSSAELASLPEAVLRLSSGCGAPVSCAGIERGDHVIDIGSGAGADCFLAAQIVGPSGRVVGIDPSPTMRAIVIRHRDELKLGWTDFLQGTAERLPVQDRSADVVISNCVLSLASDPVAIWREIARVLRPGGRFVVSDIIGGPPETPENKTRCETGLTWPEYRQALVNAGFTGIEALRVRAVAFRDGYRSQSVTLRGSAGMPPVHRTAQVFALARHHPIARRVVALCGRAGHQRGAQLGLRIIDLADRDGQSVLRLLLETDLPLWAGETWPTLAVAGEGRLIMTWDASGTGELEASTFVDHALDRLLMTGYVSQVTPLGVGT